MIARIQRLPDAFVAAALGIGSFVLLFINYWYPPDKIFDEVYFARAAEEYLKRMYIYESTHPPVTKLLITLSTMMFGGLAHGDTSYGWRFLDVVAGAVAVVLAYVLARRITRSTIFAAYAAVLFGCDGLHFVQARIATPESFVVCFSLATLYCFLRYWDAIAESTTTRIDRPMWQRTIEILVAAAIAAAFVLVRFRLEAGYAKITAGVAIAAALFAAYRLSRDRPTGWPWLLAFAFCAAVLVCSKWYGVMTYGCAAVVIAYVAVTSWVRGKTRNPFPVDTILACALGAIGIVYALAYIPHFRGLSDVAGWPPRPYTLTNVVDMLVGMYNYHAHLTATHPYSSVWWQWPLDLRPVLYYASYGRDAAGAGTTQWIIALANPLLVWGGLIGVPFTAVLAWRERDRGYALVILAYLLQWLPWMFSPRIAFAYHFYVDIPLIAICMAVMMQWIWERFRDTERRATAMALVAAYALVVVVAFAYFYPVLAGVTLPSAQASQRIWLRTWI